MLIKQSASESMGQIRPRLGGQGYKVLSTMNAERSPSPGLTVAPFVSDDAMTMASPHGGFPSAHKQGYGSMHLRTKTMGSALVLTNLPAVGHSSKNNSKVPPQTAGNQFP